MPGHVPDFSIFQQEQCALTLPSCPRARGCTYWFQFQFLFTVMIPPHLNTLCLATLGNCRPPLASCKLSRLGRKVKVSFKMSGQTKPSLLRPSQNPRVLEWGWILKTLENPDAYFFIFFYKSSATFPLNKLFSRSPTCQTNQTEASLFGREAETRVCWVLFSLVLLQSQEFSQGTVRDPQVSSNSITLQVSKARVREGRISPRLYRKQQPWNEDASLLISSLYTYSHHIHGALLTVYHLLSTYYDPIFLLGVLQSSFNLILVSTLCDRYY